MIEVRTVDWVLEGVFKDNTAACEYALELWTRLRVPCVIVLNG